MFPVSQSLADASVTWLSGYLLGTSAGCQQKSSHFPPLAPMWGRLSDPFSFLRQADISRGTAAERERAKSRLTWLLAEIKSSSESSFKLYWSFMCTAQFIRLGLWDRVWGCRSFPLHRRTWALEMRDLVGECWSNRRWSHDGCKPLKFWMSGLMLTHGAHEFCLLGE